MEFIVSEVKDKDSINHHITMSSDTVGCRITIRWRKDKIPELFIRQLYTKTINKQGYKILKHKTVKNRYAREMVGKIKYDK